MSLILFRYGSRRCLSVFRTQTPAVVATKENKVPAPPKTNVSNESYVQAFKSAEDVDQKHVTVPMNRDLYPPNTPTHTGQVYDDNDYRNVRFLNKGKLVCLYNIEIRPNKTRSFLLGKSSICL